MAMNAAADTIAKALNAIRAAYWDACDAERRAIDPDDLGAPGGLLDDAYDVALRVEGMARRDGLAWAAARELF